jgi:ATP-dependent DNA helicase RecQ
LELYAQGHRPEEIAQLRNLRRSTVIRHLATLIEAGDPRVELDDLVPRDRQQAIWTALETTGSARLGEVRAHLKHQYSYDEICLVRGQYQRARSS